MINTKVAKLKINLLNYDYSACLFIYDDSVLEKGFTTYIDELFKKSKVENRGARIMVKSPSEQYISNTMFLKDIYSHKQENHIIIFKNKKMIAYAPLDKVIENYHKVKLKLTK